MGKIYKQYLNLKKQDNSSLYLFKSGLFYICLDEDANILSSTLNLKLTNFDGKVMKCGFPTNSLSNYIIKMQDNNINYKLIDNLYNLVEDTDTYLNNMKNEKIINFIKKIDIEEISPKEAFNILFKLKEML